MSYDKLPGNLGEGMRRYLERGVAPGDFMMAVLCNDLIRAVYHADDDNIHQFKNIVTWLMAHAHVDSYGDPAKVAKWMREKRRLRIVT